MSPVDVAAVKRAWPLVDTLARRYGVPLRLAGQRRLQARCPLPGHDHDREPSFVVYPEQESFYCFGCGRGGDVITLVETIEGIDFRAAVDRLTGGQSGGESVGQVTGPLGACQPPGGRQPQSARASPRRPVGSAPASSDALAVAVDFAARRLQADAAALAYLRSRGLDAAVIARHRLGLAGGLTDYLAWRRLPLGPFHQAGLLHRDGRERLAGRVVIPELVGGRPTWLTARLVPRAAQPPDAPRYESLPGPRPLLGLGRLSAGCQAVIIAEGPFDWLLLCAWGYPALDSLPQPAGLAARSSSSLARERSRCGKRRRLRPSSCSPPSGWASALISTRGGPGTQVSSYCGRPPSWQWWRPLVRADGDIDMVDVSIEFVEKSPFPPLMRYERKWVKSKRTFTYVVGADGMALGFAALAGLRLWESGGTLAIEVVPLGARLDVSLGAHSETIAEVRTYALDSDGGMESLRLVNRAARSQVEIRPRPGPLAGAAVGAIRHPPSPSLRAGAEAMPPRGSNSLTRATNHHE